MHGRPDVSEAEYFPAASPTPFVEFIEHRPVIQATFEWADKIVDSGPNLFDERLSRPFVEGAFRCCDGDGQRRILEILATYINRAGWDFGIVGPNESLIGRAKQCQTL